ncbi:Gpi1-domain-containing protein [Tilletiaria anomala UBC 951]|uniref:Gpi1-domain-containing protein n=1 Tax=Tilletiaria anomala (strain ATCC 24038 / CBS 436.72 / UBC 951) TaxID=1037660 RepID=A0A066WKF8_TILAU|nr:Gpi1-domain-containing protein [Tilletiaria anomala UBC 951]KDN53058.1 Gpi1-domain-containing protein [Tilletiaria anomala UBC 951]
MAVSIRIFWPKQLARKASASVSKSEQILLGWQHRRNNELHVVVIGAVADQDHAELQVAIDALNLRAGMKKPAEGTPMVEVLGFLMRGQESQSSRDTNGDGLLVFFDAPKEKRSRGTLWFSNHTSFHPPEKKEFRTMVVFYDPPSSDHFRFLTIEPLRFSPAFLHDEVRASGVRSMKDSQRDYERMLSRKLMGLRELESLGSEAEYEDAELLRCSIALLNQSASMMQLLKHIQEFRRPPSASNIPSQPSIVGAVCWKLLLAAGKGIVAPLHVMRMVASQDKLIRSSLTAKQVELRLSQIINWPSFAASLRQLRRTVLTPVSALSTDYITLWGGAWLIANDVVFGQAAAALLDQTAPGLAEILQALISRHLYHGVEGVLGWLEAWPAGLKLNTELSLFFGDLYKGCLILFYDMVLARLAVNMQSIIAVISLVMRYTGLTMGICLLSDLITISTLHLVLFHRMSRFLYAGFLWLLGALFHLFRGKKRNPLRKGRLDDASYELDQMLLGTILFTLLLFLFPTIATYYLTFACARFCLIATQAALGTALAVLNHIPLFALLLRIKDPERLPAGLSFRPPHAHLPRTAAVGSNGGRDGKAISVVELASVPLSVGNIFDGYGAHLAELQELPRLFMQIFSGGRMSPRRGSSV